MPRYYVNKEVRDENNRYHEVHTEDCKYLPNETNRLYLGYFNDCEGAVSEAKKIYPLSDGCKHCSPKCNNY